MKKLTTAVLSTLLTLGLAGAAQADDPYKELVDKKGNITLPDDYRNGEWAFLGSYFVKNQPSASMTEGGAEELSFDVHTVYTQPSSLKYYRKHGRFPDGAVILKDVNGTKTEVLTTGEVRYNDQPKVTFAMVKDNKNRFPKNKAWGEGWGWALFTPDSPTSQTTNWKGEGFNNCHGCHLPVKDNDWVYTQGYKAVLGK